METEIIPDLTWYQEKSKSTGNTPRCPFASLRRCPKYYFSIWIMGEYGGASKIDEKTDQELQAYWEKTDLWPIPKELEPAAAGPLNDTHIFSNICPEVSYERFGYFASGLYAYSDEIDKDIAHKRLSETNAKHNHWGWAWAGVTPQHFSDCPYFSQLLAGVKEMSEQSPKRKIGF